MDRSRERFRQGATPVLLTVALLASYSQPAAPATDPERGERYTAYFNEAGTNGDGVIDEAEIDAVADADFATLDYNGDGLSGT